MHAKILCSSREEKEIMELLKLEQIIGEVCENAD
jgi:hypothetical protein